MSKPVAPPKPVKVKPEDSSERKPSKVKPETRTGRKAAKIKPEVSSELNPVKVKPKTTPGRRAAKVKPEDVSELKAVEVKPEATPERKPRVRSTKQGSKKAITKPPLGDFRHRLLLITLEVLGLMITAVLTIMVILGYSANWFSGTSFFTSLLPFAIGVLGMIVVTTGLLLGWWKLRKWSQGRAPLMPPILSICFALVIG